LPSFAATYNAVAAPLPIWRRASHACFKKPRVYRERHALPPPGWFAAAGVARGLRSRGRDHHLPHHCCAALNKQNSLYQRPLCRISNAAKRFLAARRSADVVRLARSRSGYLADLIKCSARNDMGRFAARHTAAFNAFSIGFASQPRGASFVVALIASSPPPSPLPCRFLLIMAPSCASGWRGDDARSFFNESMAAAEGTSRWRRHPPQGSILRRL
jgi:hypothetical protein